VVEIRHVKRSVVEECSGDLVGVETFYGKPFVATATSRNQPNCGLWDVTPFRDEADQFLVGGPIHRRRLDANLDCLAASSGYLCFRCPRLHVQLNETRCLSCGPTI
jgi:hypothetical protein